MDQPTPTRVDENGNVTIPSGLLQDVGIDKGSFVFAEESKGGILLRPVKEVSLEEYTPERVAEFVLGGAIDKASYEEAVKEVRNMGLDPKAIDHFKPNGVD